MLQALANFFLLVAIFAFIIAGVAVLSLLFTWLMDRGARNTAQATVEPRTRDGHE